MSTPSWLTDERLRLYSRAVLVALGASVLISWVVASGAESPFGRVGGDFASFYAAGAMVVDGADAATLYDPAAQQAAQAELLPGDAWLWFAYPAAVAVAYAPLSLIPFPTSWLLHTAAMATALYGAVRLLRPVLGLREQLVLPWFVAMLSFYPMFRSVAGGQNTALTALLVAATVRALHDGLDGRAGLATWVGRLATFQSAAQQIEVFTSVGRWGWRRPSWGGGRWPWAWAGSS